MPENNVPLLKQLTDIGLGYLWILVLAMWGGTASYISRWKSGGRERFSIVELLGEWVISGFSGLITAFVCAEMGMAFMYTAAAAGIAGHMGGRGIFMLERLLQRRFGLSGENKSDL